MILNNTSFLTYSDSFVSRELVFNKPTKPIYTSVKRFLDVFISLPLLIALSPLFFIIALIVKCSSRGSVIFKQERVGMNGNTFTIYKFRTMTSNAPEISTTKFKDSCNYITKIGRILRKSSLDELPQLYNVLRGDMSIIGPRPLIKGESDIHRNRMIKGIYDIRPGITGLAQINGRDCIDDNEKLYYDYQYLIHRSLLLDFMIFLKTFLSVIKSEGHSEGH